MRQRRMPGSAALRRDSSAVARPKKGPNEARHEVAAEYSVEALVADTGKTCKQTYSDALIAEDGRIKLLREVLDTAEAARAFNKH